MAFPDDQMFEELTIHGRTGVTGLGETVFGSDTAETWYLEPGFKLITNRQGEEVTASLFGIGPADSVLAVGDTVSWEGATYRVLDVQPVRLAGATHHTEAYFGGLAS